MKRAAYAPDQNLAAAVLPHDAYWSIEPAAGRRLWQMLQSESFAVHMAAADTSRKDAKAHRGGEEDKPAKPFEMSGSTAVLYCTGPMTKAPTSMSSGTSTVRLRRQVRQAAADDDVSRIVLRIDSPGGSVSGTGDLAADVRAAALVKSVIAYCEDCCCSAAYWIASQCSAIYANETALAGSIGTLLVIDDSSRLYENAGVEVLVFGSGLYKGAGTDGTAVTPAHRAYFEAIVDNLNTHFLAAVKRGRSLTDEQLIALTDARVHVGQAAVEMGLVDGICSLDDVLAGKMTVPPRQRTAAKSGGANNYSPQHTARTGTEEKRTMRNPFAAFNIFKAGMQAAGADVTEDGGTADEAQTSLQPVYISSPPAPAKIDLTQNAEYQALKAQNDTLTTQLAALNTQIGGLSAAMTAQLAAAQYAADAERVEKLVRQMKMTPAEGTTWKALAKDNPAAFAAAFATQEARPVLSQLKGDVVRAKLADQGEPGAQLGTLAAAYAREHKCSLSDAALAVVRQHPELARAHADSAPVLATEGSN